MAWRDERLLPVERLLYRGRIVKVGQFDCPADHACFPRTAPLQNDLLVFVRRPLWWRRGAGRYRFVEPGAALLHRAGRAIERRSVGKRGDHADWFGIRSDVFRATLEATGADPARVTERGVSLVSMPRIRWRAQRLLSDLARHGGDALAVEEGAIELLEAVAAGLADQGPRRGSGRASTRARRRRLVDRAREWLTAHPDSSCGLADVARAVGTSPWHLARVFREECGVTLHAYRQRQRLGLAIARLLEGPQDLSALAHELGYSSHSHFTREFRRHLGVTPSVLAVL
jgi:AraC-like DNA-binding protein